MARILANDVVLLRAYSYASAIKQVGINDYWWFCGSNIGLGATDVQFASSMSAQLGAVYTPVLCISAAFVGVTVNIFRGTSKPTLTVIDKSGAGTGISGLSQLPGAIAGLIKKRGAVGGRRGQGRVYIPFPATVSSDANGKPTVTYQGLMHNISSVLDTVQTVGTAPDQSTLVSCLYARSDHFKTTILAHSESEEFATQHSRGGYGKENPLPF